MPIITSLPAGCTIDRSVGPIYLGEADGNDIAAAILWHPSEGKWYAADARGPHGEPPMSVCGYFGPYDTKAGARAEIESTTLQYLDDEGTDGASTWLTPP